MTEHDMQKVAVERAEEHIKCNLEEYRCKVRKRSCEIR